MKTIFRSLGFAVMLGAVTAAGTTAAYAQDACADYDGQAALYEKFTTSYSKTTLADLKTTIDLGKQFLEKYGACESVKEQTDYMKGAIPALEKSYAEREKASDRKAIIDRIEGALPEKKWDEAFAAGNELFTKFPNDPTEIHFLISLGQVGLLETYNKNTKYNDQSIRYAKKAIEMIKGGAAPKSNGNFGVFQFEGKKDDVISALNYAIAHIMFYEKKDQKGSMPYFYEIAQSPGMFKTDPRVYQAIGIYYIDQAAPIGEEIQKLIAAQSSGTDEEKLARENEIKAKIALFNGYTERAIDAYARAAEFAKADTPAQKTYKEGLAKTVEDLYKRRFENTNGLAAYKANAVKTPLPDPLSEVKPVADPEAAKPAADSTGTAPAAAASKPTPATAAKKGTN